MLTKRYSDPNDLPVLSESEIKTVIEHINSSCEKYGLGLKPIKRMTPDMHAIVSFYNGLSVFQKDNFINTGINFRDLQQDQQNLIERLLLNTYFGSILSACFQAKIIISETQGSQIHAQEKQAIISFYRMKNIGDRSGSCWGNRVPTKDRK